MTWSPTRKRAPLLTVIAVAFVASGVKEDWLTVSVLGRRASSIHSWMVEMGVELGITEVIEQRRLEGADDPDDAGDVFEQLGQVGSGGERGFSSERHERFPLVGCERTCDADCPGHGMTRVWKVGRREVEVGADAAPTSRVRPVPGRRVSSRVR